MKYKVGDMVRIKKDLKVGDYFKIWMFIKKMNKYKGKTTKIKKVCDDYYKLDIDNECFIWTDEMLEPVQKNQDIIEYQGKKYEVTNQIVYSDNSMNLVLQEHKEEILDKEEKEYLSAVIKPFRNKINYIIKMDYFDNEEYLIINIKKNDNLGFPFFKKNTMYKNMKVNKEYTLEELGL